MLRVAITVLVTSMLVVLPGAPWAQSVKFPPPLDTATDANAAETAFQERANAIIVFNACGREQDYTSYRLAMQQGDHGGDQGENLISIIIGKIAFLTNPRFADQTCEYKLLVQRPADPNTHAPIESPQEFIKSVLGAFMDPATPTNCSAPLASPIIVGETELVVTFRSDRACLSAQINEGLRAIVKTSQMGTDGLVCISGIPLGNFMPKGDFDVVVRDAVRAFYMGTRTRSGVLDKETVDYLYEHVLAARGVLSPAAYSLTTDCNAPAGDELGSPEDFADREYWYNELLDSIGDFFTWLITFPVKIAVASTVTVTGLTFAPFLAAAGENPLDFIVADVEVGETENHRLMIEGSKFLINQAIIRELIQIKHDNVDEIQAKQNGVRAWLLQTMQNIVISDFQEYNARAYNRYSLNAILNLYDFAADDEIRTAAQSVLDLSAAKFAAGSNRARRIVPFRRLAKNDWKPLYEVFMGGDHEIARGLVLAGQTQLLRDGIDPNAARVMIYAAVSPYRLPQSVLETAVGRSVPFAQRIDNPGEEGYFASPAFTMSLGGRKSKAALETVGFSNGDDHGAAMPTVIIPTSRGKNMEDLFLFRGLGEHQERTDNTCGWNGFICGIAPNIPHGFSCGTVIESSSTERLVFVNSAKCPPDGPPMHEPYFYLAGRFIPCKEEICGRHNEGLEFGFMEIVEAPGAVEGGDPAFQAFRQERKAAFLDTPPDANGVGMYRTKAGDLVHFSIDPERAKVLDVNGEPTPDDIIRAPTSGGVINADGKGNVIIFSPSSGAHVAIDFTDWANPKRTSVP